MVGKSALCIKFSPQPPAKKTKRGGAFTEPEVAELEGHFHDHIEWGKTPSISACRDFLELYPHPEKGRIAHDIQDKMKRIISEAKGKDKRKK